MNVQKLNPVIKQKSEGNLNHTHTRNPISFPSTSGKGEFCATISLYDAFLHTEVILCILFDLFVVWIKKNKNKPPAINNKNLFLFLLPKQFFPSPSKAYPWLHSHLNPPCELTHRPLSQIPCIAHSLMSNERKKKHKATLETKRSNNRY